MNLKLDLKSSRSKLVGGYLFAIACFLLGLLFSLILTYPKAKSFSKLISQKKEEESALAKLKSKADTLKNELAPYSDVLNKNYDKVAHALPSVEDVPGLMSQLEEMASSSGLLVEGMQFSGSSKKTLPTNAPTSSTTVADTSAKEVSVQMTLSGNYDALVTFLEKVENASRIVVVDSLKFSPLQGEEGGSGFTFNLGVISFYSSVPEEKDVTAPIDFSITSPSFKKVITEVDRLTEYEGKSP